jgi:uncharacterized protein
MTLRPTFAATLMTALLLSAAPLARADEETDARTVSVTGTATVYVVPDEATLRFSIQTFHADLSKSKALNDDQTGTALAFLKQQGVEEKDVQTFFANAEAVYERKEEDGQWVRGEVKGYTVTKHFSVKLRRLDNFSRILDQMLTNPSVSVQSYSFESSKNREHRDEARRKAVTAAKEKAQLLADQLGVGVGAPRSISEAVMYEGGYNRMVQNANFDAGPNVGGDGATPVGQIELSAQVSVSFDLVVEGK